MDVNYGSEGSEEGPPFECVLAEQDISTLCMSILIHKKETGRALCHTLRIDIHAGIGDSMNEARDEMPHPQSRLCRLLEPFRQLHSGSDITIKSPGSEAYLLGFKNSMLAPPPSAIATMSKVIQALDQGDRARNYGDLPLAIVKYRNGLDDIISSNYDVNERDDLLKFGPDAGQTIRQYVSCLLSSRIDLAVSSLSLCATKCG